MTTRELITTAQFEAFLAQPENAHRRFELINGEIVEKPMPTRQHGQIAGLFATWVNLYFLEHRDAVGNVAVEARHRPTGDQHNDRLPDISIVLEAKPLLERGVEDYIPDICIEIQSPDDSLREMRETAQFYLAHGAKVALVVLSKRRVIEVYPSDGDFDVLTVEDTLNFGDLLPGFAVPVKRFFPD